MNIFDSTYSGRRALKSDFKVGKSFRLGGLDNDDPQSSHFIGNIGFVDIWLRTLSIQEMVLFTTSKKPNGKVDPKSQIVNWTEIDHGSIQHRKKEMVNPN